MRVNANNYDEARSLLDDPKVAEDPELGPALREEISLYETSQQVGGAFSGFAGPTGLQAIEETGLFPEAPEDDKLVSQQDKFMQKGARSVSKAAARAPKQIENAPLPTIDESNEALTGDPVSDSLMNIQRMDRDTEESLGLANRTETNASASKLDKLYRQPEFMPAGKNFWDYANATYYYEPPVSLVQEALKGKYLNDGWSEEAADQAVSKISEDSDEYQRFADALWVETYENAKAAGKPALRTKYMQDGGWRTQARVQGAVVPFAYGIDRSLTGGAASELTSALIEDEPTRRARQAEVEASPIATGAGAIVGALAPGGLTGRVYSSLAGGIPRGAGLGTRLAGQAAAGAGTGAVESLAQDAVHNLSEMAFTDNPRYRSEADVARGMGLSALAGAGGGVLGEGIASLASAGVRKLRSGKMGPALRRAEEGGATTSLLRGAEMTPAMKADEAYALQHKIAPEDLMAQNVADPIAAQAMRESRELAERQAAENALVGPGTKLGKKENPIQPVVTQVRKELDALFDPKTGRADPLIAGERKELGTLLSEVVEIRVMPAAGRAPPGFRRVKAEEVEKLLDRAPELVPMVRQAQRDAKDPFARRKVGGRKKTARQALSPEPADIGGASTVRDPGSTMVPPPFGPSRMPAPGETPFDVLERRAHYWREDIEHQHATGAISEKTARKWLDDLSAWTQEEALIIKMREAGAPADDIYPMAVANDAKYPFHDDWRMGGSGGAPMPPPTEANPTMPSPAMPGQYRTKPPNVNVEEPDPGDLVGEVEIGGKKMYVPGEIEGHVYVLGPRKMDPGRLERFERRVNDLVETSEGRGPYKRILASILETRDKFDFPGAAPMRKGDLRLKGLSAKKAEHQMQLEQQMNKQELAGLPRRDLKPMPEYEAQAIEPPMPMLTGAERKGLTGAVAGHGGPGRPESDEAQRRLADAAGVLPELKQLVSYKAVKELQKAASFKSAIGSRLMPTLYSGQPLSTIGLRADPMLRALAGDAPKAVPISDALYSLVKKMAGGARSPSVETSRGTQETVSALRVSRLNPLATMQGASSRGSARRLAQASAGGEDQRRGHRLTDLSSEEVMVLLRLAAMVRDTERKKASGE